MRMILNTFHCIHLLFTEQCSVGRWIEFHIFYPYICVNTNEKERKKNGKSIETACLRNKCPKLSATVFSVSLKKLCAKHTVLLFFFILWDHIEMWNRAKPNKIYGSHWYVYVFGWWFSAHFSLKSIFPVQTYGLLCRSGSPDFYDLVSQTNFIFFKIEDQKSQIFICS